jgi:hypothetical protein
MQATAWTTRVPSRVTSYGAEKAATCAAPPGGAENVGEPSLATGSPHCLPPPGKGFCPGELQMYHSK